MINVLRYIFLVVLDLPKISQFFSYYICNAILAWSECSSDEDFVSFCHF